MRNIKSFNAPAFNAADDALQAAGHETLNPARVDEANGFDLMGYDGTEDLTGIGFNLRDVLGADLAWIAEHADGVAVLPGWVYSLGAKAEVATAEALGLPVHDVDYWTGDGAVVYVPAIGDRVRIVDGDYIESEHVGIVTSLDPEVFRGENDRPHPIGVTEDDGPTWYAVEVELIETAAEIAEYEEACRKHEEWVAHWDDGYDHTSDSPPHTHGGTDAPECTSCNPSTEVRVTSATGGQKGQKPAQLSTVDAVALLKLAEVGGYGGRKYEPHNYLRGYAWSLSLDALFRHTLAFESGEDFDPESGLPHVTHAAWHCLALTSFMVRGLGTDDRFKQNGV